MFFNKFICNSLTTKGNEVIIIIAVHVTYLHPSTKYLFVLSKATHHRTGNTIETNLKNLNVNQFDLAFEVSWSTCLLLTTYVTVGRERGHREGENGKNNYRKPQYTDVSDLGYSYGNDNKNTNNDSNVSKG